ncbi:hypothetical protein SFRURICE_009006 [Spodoptera frugiperda]|nr:hypothetical protein SFRURICE_009006 [Spodoptera frugiperda]
MTFDLIEFFGEGDNGVDLEFGEGGLGHDNGLRDDDLRDGRRGQDDGLRDHNLGEDGLGHDNGLRDHDLGEHRLGQDHGLGHDNLGEDGLRHNNGLRDGRVLIDGLIDDVDGGGLDRLDGGADGDVRGSIDVHDDLHKRQGVGGSHGQQGEQGNEGFHCDWLSHARFQVICIKAGRQNDATERCRNNATTKTLPLVSPKPLDNFPPQKEDKNSNKLCNIPKYFNLLTRFYPQLNPSSLNLWCELESLRRRRLRERMYLPPRFAWKLCHVAPSLSKSTFFKPLSETRLEQISSV